MQNTKNNDQTKLQFNNEDNNLVLTVGKKEFNHKEHERVFLNFEWVGFFKIYLSVTFNGLTLDEFQLKHFDKESEAFSNILTEYQIKFAPSYPFEENISKATSYMPTRCPAWCDRILFSHSAEKIIDNQLSHEYDLLGLKTCMGDHKVCCFYRVT